jgi:hypothetical protein
LDLGIVCDFFFDSLVTISLLLPAVGEDSTLSEKIWKYYSKKVKQVNYKSFLKFDFKQKNKVKRELNMQQINKKSQN